MLRSMGWQAKIGLKEGIETTYAWYLVISEDDIRLMSGRQQTGSLPSRRSNGIRRRSGVRWIAVQPHPARASSPDPGNGPPEQGPDHRPDGICDDIRQFRGAVGVGLQPLDGQSEELATMTISHHFPVAMAARYVTGRCRLRGQPMKDPQ
jgi:hypothetical protein